MAATGKGKPKADINVVPLVDICLVLLIIFMVVTPMLQDAVQVKLPRAENGEEKDQRNIMDIIVAIKEDGSIYLVDTAQPTDTAPTPMSKAELETALTAILAREPYRPVLIKGDARLTYGEVKKIMLAAQHAGAGGVNLAAEGKKDKDGDKGKKKGDEMAAAGRVGGGA